jgi:antitoxin (DNA-binding transcriptional repressor) of toxin-antitoxin stability system
MVITMQQLKTQPGRIFGKINKGQEMAISYRGRICAKIVPLGVKLADNEKDSGNKLFGMWRDRDDIGDASQYVRKIRKARKLC